MVSQQQKKSSTTDSYTQWNIIGQNQEKSIFLGKPRH